MNGSRRSARIWSQVLDLGRRVGVFDASSSGMASLRSLLAQLSEEIFGVEDRRACIL